MQREKKHRLTRTERIQIEALWKAGHTREEIAAQMGRHYSTVCRELNRGKTVRRNSDWTEVEIYSPDLAQWKYEQGLKKKGRALKLGENRAFLEYIEDKVLNRKRSPGAALAEMQEEGTGFKTKICLSTLYNYIRGNRFPNICLARCPYHSRGKGSRGKKKVQKRKCPGRSIEQRPAEVDTRETFGHWEMDTVIGKSTDRKCLLVFTERRTRKELVELLESHTAAEVVKALDRIERRFTEKGFRQIFKTITVDNGPEFADAAGMERSRRNKRNRTEIYYCHPYSSYERGSNENQNRMLRRFFPKGKTMRDVTRAAVKEAEEWINSYPRKIHGYRTAEELFREECEKLRVV